MNTNKSEEGALAFFSKESLGGAKYDIKAEKAYEFLAFSLIFVSTETSNYWK